MRRDRDDDPSTTPQRWGVTPRMRVWVGGHGLGAKREVERHLASTVRPPAGPIDLAFITPQTVDEAVYFAAKLRHRLRTHGAIWVVYPRSASPRKTEFDAAQQTLVDRLCDAHFVETGTTSLNDDYLSSRFEPVDD